MYQSQYDRYDMPEIKLTKHFLENTNGTDYIVGDLHGEYYAFREELEKVDFDPKVDRVFSVGDLVDRGPDSETALHLLDMPWFHAVLGNHEDFVLGSHGKSIWYMNGGKWADDVEDLMELRKLIYDKMTLTITLNTKNGVIGIVHAESEDDWNDNIQDSRNLNTWARTMFRYMAPYRISNIDMVVVGHTALKRPVQLGNVLNIDTGAGKGGYVTLIKADDVFNEEYKRVFEPSPKVTKVLDDNF
jgi:serine/threonine protein phosphatase 1